MSRLSLESLETRETPAVIQPQLIFMNPDGGAEAVRHRMFAIVDRTQAAPTGSHALYQDVVIPTATAHDDVWVDGKVITGENYRSSAIVFVGGWGSSMYQY